MDEKNIPKNFLKERFWGKAFLYFECAYVALLLYYLLFNFALFMHLLVGQFIIILLYNIAGWISGIYLRAKGKLPVDERQKETLREKLSYRISKKSLYRFFEIVLVFFGVGVADFLFSQSYVYFTDNFKHYDVFHTVINYAYFGDFLIVFGIIAAILMGKRLVIIKMEIVGIVLTAILIATWPIHWVTLLLSILFFGASLFLCLNNQV